MRPLVVIFVIFRTWYDAILEALFTYEDQKLWRQGKIGNNFLPQMRIVTMKQLLQFITLLCLLSPTGILCIILHYWVVFGGPVRWTVNIYWSKIQNNDKCIIRIYILKAKYFTMRSFWQNNATYDQAKHICVCMFFNIGLIISHDVVLQEAASGEAVRRPWFFSAWEICQEKTIPSSSAFAFIKW